jgi:hypothetical protein
LIQRDLEAATTSARLAFDLGGRTSPGTLAVLAAIRLAAGDPAGALPLALRAMDTLSQCEAFEHGGAFIRQVLAEVLLANDRADEAGAVAADAAQRVRVLATRLEDPERRRSFLERVPENARLVELDAALRPR